MVGFAAGCALMEPWAAIITGFVSAVVQYTASWFLIRMGIDDPLDASSVHGFCGIWGVLVVGLLAKKQYVMQESSPVSDSSLRCCR